MLYQVRELRVGDVDQAGHDEIQCGITVELIELGQPQCKTLHDTLARAEALVAVIFVVGQELQTGDVSQDELLTLLIHNLGQKMLCVFVFHGLSDSCLNP